MPSRARLVLLPGLGADERLFAGLGPLGLPVVAARLPVPHRHECFHAYALRVAAGLELRPEDWIGGASFGSLVAADIARRRPLAGLVLLGGGLSSATVIRPARALAAAARWLPLRPLRALLACPALLGAVFQPITPAARQQLVAMLAATPDDLLREGARLVSSYFPNIPPLCPVHAIHGRDDRLMRPPPVPACRLVNGAGHALVLTHAREVTGFLDETLGR
jgi:hypothetical protein